MATIYIKQSCIMYVYAHVSLTSLHIYTISVKRTPTYSCKQYLPVSRTNNSIQIKHNNTHSLQLRWVQMTNVQNKHNQYIC